MEKYSKDCTEFRAKERILKSLFLTTAEFSFKRSDKHDTQLKRCRNEIFGCYKVAELYSIK